MFYSELSEEGFSPPNRDNIIREATRALGLTAECEIIEVQVDGVILEKPTVPSQQRLTPDERDPSSSVRPIYEGLPGSGKRY